MFGSQYHGGRLGLHKDTENITTALLWIKGNVKQKEL